VTAATAMCCKVDTYLALANHTTLSSSTLLADPCCPLRCFPPFAPCLRAAPSSFPCPTRPANRSARLSRRLNGATAACCLRRGRLSARCATRRVC
jgi:hypothetical protein